MNPFGSNPTKVSKLVCLAMAMAIDEFVKKPVHILREMCADYGTLRVLSNPRTLPCLAILAGFVIMGIAFHILWHIDWQKPGGGGFSTEAA